VAASERVTIRGVYSHPRHPERALRIAPPAVERAFPDPNVKGPARRRAINATWAT
jgi:hypothetical protein